MKKIICILMIVLMLMGICSITASAEESTDNWLFYQKFSDTYAFPQYGTPVVFYEEVYYHYSTDDVVEWALIRGSTPPPPLVAYPYGIFENRLIRKIDGSIGTFYLDYAVYDVSDDKFYDLGEAYANEKYHDEINKYLNEYDIGEIIGDMDNDKKLTVKDATYIQKCLAGIMEYPENDKVEGVYESNKDYGHLAYLSDFNRDGVRNIKDATAIQKHIAGIEP